ncbi:MAG: hypothetical protein WAQ53_15370 [Thiofilum sp.]|uniref:hypothetical protein n=1 Tax=Thiofilum sp. TaxID=2212733 RepID=UPI0025E4D361|nr:hypothetical protein [Thiofilum sp.]MBK8451772.1 hypothetical protein [Thiofilum sp.]
MTAHTKTHLDDFFKRFNDRLKNPQTPDEQADFNECLEERSAIMEYEGGLPRHEAELQARVICLTEYRNKRGIKA